ncbi:MAG: hypothetical protein ACFCGT_20180 [Sandaracinaceae bacterium]
MAGAFAISSTERDVYANLLRDSRGLRRDQSSAREGWYDALPGERKEQTLFELEMLLKGVACFGNARNHSGTPRTEAAVAHDFRQELLILRDVVAQINGLVKQLLGDRERAYAFTRYLESVLPEDTARGRLLKEQLTQDTPEESLFLLRNAFGGFQDLADALLRLPQVTHRAYHALHGVLAREIGRNVFFNPLLALEFRPEFDRIRSPEVLDVLRAVETESAHRILALSLLALFRALRYVDLVDRYASEAATARRAYVILAVLRSDMRTLTRYLAGRAADALAEGYERELLAIHAVELPSRTGGLERRARWLISLRNGLESLANSLRVDIRKAFLHDLPGPSDEASTRELAPQLVVAAAAIRASVHHAIRSLCATVDPARPPPTLALDAAGQRASGERMRREIWMFMQILRAFIAKAKAAQQRPDSWNGGSSLTFVVDFLTHFRAIGYQQLRLNGYERVDPFLDSLERLRDIDLLEASRLQDAVAECHRAYAFLEGIFRSVSQGHALSGVAFDRRDATEALKIYLGRA